MELVEVKEKVEAKTKKRDEEANVEDKVAEHLPPVLAYLPPVQATRGEQAWNLHLLRHQYQT